MEALLRPVDAARVRALRALGPVSRVLAADRDKRVGAAAVLAAVVALATTTLAPMWTIALAPLVFGVPHLVADVRYLVVRPGLHREARLAVFAGTPLAIASFGGGLRAGLVATAAALVVAAPPGRRARAIAAAAVLAPVAWLAWRHPAAADATFAQLHNVVAIAIWWAWRPRAEQTKWRWAGLAAFGLCAGAVLAGAADPLVAHGLGWASHARGLGVGGVAEALAPGLPTRWALRLVLLFAFGQSVHYAIWLRMIPDEDRPRVTPRTFRASLHALRADLGVYAIGAAALLALLLVGWGMFDLAAARDAYVRFAVFHGSLELVAIAVAFARGRLAA